MAGAFPSTLHRLMKFVWDNHEVVIHSEKIHSNDYAPIVDNVIRVSNFYTVEIVNATGDNLALLPPMPFFYKMIATLMLRSEFESGFGLGKYKQGITEPIQIVTKGSMFGLGYIPIADDEMKALGKKVVDWELAKLVPRLYRSFPVQENANDDGLRMGIENHFEEFDVVLEDMIETSCIQDAKPDERVLIGHLHNSWFLARLN